MRKMLMIMLIMAMIVPSAYVMRTDLTLSASEVMSNANSVMASVRFEQDNYLVAVNSTFSAKVMVLDVQNCTCWQAYIYFDKAIVSCLSVTEGSFLKQVGRTFLYRQINNNYNATHGRIVLACTLLGLTVMANGSGVLAMITFKALAVGSSPLHLTSVLLGDEHIPPKPIPVVVSDSWIMVI